MCSAWLIPIPCVLFSLLLSDQGGGGWMAPLCPLGGGGGGPRYVTNVTWLGVIHSELS